MLRPALEPHRQAAAELNAMHARGRLVGACVDALEQGSGAPGRLGIVENILATIRCPALSRPPSKRPKRLGQD